MTDETANEVWPFTAMFRSEKYPVTFDSADSVRRWAAKETEFWNRIASNGGQSANAVVGNFRKLESVQRATSDQAVQTALNSISDYYCSQGPLGTLLGRVPDSQMEAGAIAFHDVASSGTAHWNATETTIRGMSLAMTYRVAGHDLGAIDRVSATLADVDRIRSSEAATVKTFEDLIARSEKEWSEKIEGFEAKVALGAPKTYWEGRADKHSKLAKAAAREWFWSLIVVGFFAVVAIVYLLLSVKPGDMISELLAAVQRLAIAGTLIALGVWWLRQKLRDRRTHEHLAEDAAERVTMIETYAAMRAAGLQDTNLAPILTALYRPAMSGLPEDQGPVLPLEILLKSVGDIATARKS